MPLLARLKGRLRRTREGLTGGLASLVLGKKRIDDQLLEEIETRLLLADVGVTATHEIIDHLTDRLARRELDDSEALFAALREEMFKILSPCAVPLQIGAGQWPFVILVVGVNGAGKTTTIGKLAHILRQRACTVLLAAGDTFRAAAVEQLQTWGKRNGVPVVAQGRDADPAAVVFDALESARAKNVDVVIADTAGRLHTKTNLMDELKKVKRVMSKLDPAAPHETLLVIDGGTGQNALAQVRQFHEALGLNGVVLTKMDGTAKGGVIFAIAKETQIPIRFIGVGEGIEDLQEFDADAFVDALLAPED